MRDLYELSRSLGHGAKSEVILGRCRRTGSFYALKFFSLGDGELSSSRSLLFSEEYRLGLLNQLLPANSFLR